MTQKQLNEIKQAFVKYRGSEGCSCCENDDVHQEAEDALGKLLGCPRYSDDSGWEWSKLENNENIMENDLHEYLSELGLINFDDTKEEVALMIKEYQA